jgi:hypothetical protein
MDAARAHAEIALRHAMEKCRQALGETFEAVKARLEDQKPPFPPFRRERLARTEEGATVSRAQDHADVYRYLEHGVAMIKGQAMLPPDWCRNRDKARTDVRRAIKKYERVLRQNQSFKGLDWCVYGLEYEYERHLAPPTHTEGPGPFDWHTNRLHLLLTGDPVKLGWSSGGGGHPPAPARSITLAMLCDAAGIKVPQELADSLRIKGVNFAPLDTELLESQGMTVKKGPTIENLKALCDAAGIKARYPARRRRSKTRR